MLNEASSEKNEALEDNLPLVNYIMSHRIYDIMVLIANMLSKSEEDVQKIEKMIEYHKDGFLLGPSPAYNNLRKENE
jgi:transcriptional regulator of NAD metabolism